MYLTRIPSAGQIKVFDIPWSPRAESVLRRLIMNDSECTLQELKFRVTLAQLAAQRNCGHKTLLEIAKTLNWFGLKMKRGSRYQTSIPYTTDLEGREQMGRFIEP